MTTPDDVMKDEVYWERVGKFDEFIFETKN